MVRFLLCLIGVLWSFPASAELKVYNAFVETTPVANSCENGENPCVDHYATAVPADLVNVVSAPGYALGTDRLWHRAAHLFVPGNEVGDVLTITGQFQMTSELPWVEFTGCLILTPTSSGTAGMQSVANVSTNFQPSQGRVMTRCNGVNITNLDHHKPMEFATTYKIPEGFDGDQYVTMMFYAAGPDHAPTSNTVIIEPYSSQIEVRRERFN